MLELSNEPYCCNFCINDALPLNDLDNDLSDDIIPKFNSETVLDPSYLNDLFTSTEENDEEIDYSKANSSSVLIALDQEPHFKQYLVRISDALALTDRILNLVLGPDAERLGCSIKFVEPYQKF